VDDAQLLAFLASGMDTALIARKLKRTTQAVHSRKRRLNNQPAGLSKSAPTERLKAARTFASAGAGGRKVKGK
jgi:hypothetical protein